MLNGIGLVGLRRAIARCQAPSLGDGGPVRSSSASGEGPTAAFPGGFQVLQALLAALARKQSNGYTTNIRIPDYRGLRAMAWISI